MQRIRGALLLLVPLATLAPGAAAQPAGPVEVDVTLVVVNFGSYDPKQGSYVVDFYMVLAWDPAEAPAGFTPEAFEFANGRATSRELQADLVNETSGKHELWYRVQASLYSDPRFEAYPFDAQTIEVRVEDTKHPRSRLVYVRSSRSRTSAGRTPRGRGRSTCAGPRSSRPPRSAPSSCCSSCRPAYRLVARPVFAFRRRLSSSMRSCTASSVASSSSRLCSRSSTASSSPIASASRMSDSYAVIS